MKIMLLGTSGTARSRNHLRTSEGDRPERAAVGKISDIAAYAGGPALYLGMLGLSNLHNDKHPEYQAAFFRYRSVEMIILCSTSPMVRSYSKVDTYSSS